MGSGHKTVKPLVLGVTGVVASGKSVFCEFLEEQLGFNWINADKLVHELYLAGNEGYKKIKEYFGGKFVGEKEVNRTLLREFVLKNPEKLRTLNEIVHPLVEGMLNKKVVQLSGVNRGKSKVLIVVEAFYLEPNMLGKFIDRKVLIDASDDVILKRLKARNLPEEQGRRLLSFQRNILPNNDERIENNGTLEEFFEKTGKWAGSLLQ
ncbi:dephospho-CoA kinase [Candidatus Peregrinibacteria bacterium]|nr:dephospho-CoA kinase [Candidatus Peregrinibacteria bacterium]